MTATRFQVVNMDCATEKAIIIRRLAKVTGISRLDFDLLERVVTVTHDDASVPASVKSALDDIEMAPVLLDGGNRQPGPAASRGLDACCDHSSGATGAAEPATAIAADAATAPVTTSHWTRETAQLAVAGACSLAAEITSWVTHRDNSAVVIGLAVLGLATAGTKTLRKGLVAARTFTLNINLLMLIAVTGAIAIQQWPEAAMVNVLFAIAEVIEVRSMDRARDAIRSLLVLAPTLTRVRQDDTWVERETRQIPVGATVQVRPGERVPLDGRLTAGTTSINQAPITGESIPVDKIVGDSVFAGTVNQQGAIEVEVTAAAGDTTLAHIARTIRQAQSQQSPTETFVDKFARYYTPAVVVMAILVALVPPLAFGRPFHPWIYKALVMLVIACPCALVISTPVTIVSGLAAAARRGLLVKGGIYLETAHELRVLAIDKTGTLTLGRPELTDVITVAALSRDEVLARAASLEATSSHPIARAVAAGFTGAHTKAIDVTAVEGKGIRGRIGDEWITVGSHRFAEEEHACSPAVEAALSQLEAAGKSVMVVWRSGNGANEPIGVLGVADELRDTSIEAVRALHARGLKLLMLTGDNATTANAVAAAVGIDEVAAGLLPEDKLARIDAMRRAGISVGMVGDGVNDAPALARASIGFAMGAAGSDTALETADVALMSDDLRGVATFIELSRRTIRTLRFNIGFAIAVKVVFFTLGLLGYAPLWMAVLSDMGSSLIVAANGLRLLRST